MSILQETMLKEGTVKVNAHKVGRYITLPTLSFMTAIQIALASQTPFIYPGTLRAS
jgi:hypothetical protein